MKNRTSRIAIFWTLVVASSIFSCNSRKDQKVEEKEMTETAESKSSERLPDIMLMPAEGKVFSAKSLEGKTILIFFAPDCDHCQREAQDVQKNMNLLEDYNLYFISMDSFISMKEFARVYSLSGYSNVKFLRAEGATVFKALGDVSTPTICIYDEHGELKHRFDGETKVEAMVPYL